MLVSHIRLFWDPMVYSPPDFFVHGILQAQILEWVAISFSRGSSQHGDQTHISGRRSCISRQVLYHWATWEAHMHMCMGTILKEHTLNFWQRFSLTNRIQIVVILLNSHFREYTPLYQMGYSILYFTIVKLYKKQKLH